MLPREIETERGPERTQFDLPTRAIGPLRFVGLVPILFGVGFVWMPVREITRMAWKNTAHNGSGFEWVFVVFLSVFVIAAMMPLGLGLFILMGRTRIIVAADRLIMTELAGPIRWSRTVKFEQVERLEIAGATMADGQTPGFLGALCGVTVTLKNGRKTPVVVGYPRAWLQPLVAEISSLMQRQGKVVPVTEAALRLEGDTQPVPTEQRVEKPAGSAIALTATDRSALFTVPPGGLFKGSYGLMPFSIMWCVIVGVISTAIILGQTSRDDLIGGLGFLSIFWAIGIGMLLTGIHLGTRRWTLRADRSQLQVTLKSALRAREWRWAAADVEDVRVGDSSTKVNGRRLEQLQVYPRSGGRKTGLLTGSTHDELAWVATTLRETLRGPTAEVTDTPPRIDPSRRGS